MKKITITADRKYEIVVDADYLVEISNITRKHQQVVLIAPTKLLKIIKVPRISNLTVISVPDGELQKSAKSLEKIWNELGKLKISRADAIIGLGGGATTDLAGFAAATWLRGISWYAIPTSLAAMVDAAIGGKCGINSAMGKNLIGAFYSPSGVYIDLKFLQTLSNRDVSAGMAEVIKCGFLSDIKLLNLVQQDVIDFKEVIYRSVKVKARVVSKDFKESKLREILNYGHTLGHAIEKHSKYKLRHGEAVSISLVFAAELSNIVGNLPVAVVEDHRRILASFNLPISYPKQHLSTLERLMISDKKVKSNQIRFIGLKKIGKPIWLESVNSKQIKMAYERIAR